MRLRTALPGDCYLLPTAAWPKKKKPSGNPCFAGHEPRQFDYFYSGPNVPVLETLFEGRIGSLDHYPFFLRACHSPFHFELLGLFRRSGLRESAPPPLSNEIGAVPFFFAILRSRPILSVFPPLSAIPRELGLAPFGGPKPHPFFPDHHH